MQEQLGYLARLHGVGVLFSSRQLELVERLCDAVAIIEGGRLRAEGAVAELRARNMRDRWLVELAGDGQDLLAAAQRAGTVRRFEPDEPTLAELFRDALDETAVPA